MAVVVVVLVGVVVVVVVLVVVELNEFLKGFVGNCREFYIVTYSTVAHYIVLSADSFRVTAMLAK